MIKPDKPSELRDVTVSAISLVSKAANGEKFKIFKSAEDEAPESVERNERGLFHILKRFFAGDEVMKGEVADITNAQDKGRRLNTAIGALLTVLGFNAWNEVDDKDKLETSPSKIRAALNDFKAVAEEILLDSDDEIQKTVSMLEKSGRKISGSRLSKLKSIQAMLQEVLNDIDDKEETSQEAEELTRQSTRH